MSENAGPQASPGPQQAYLFADPAAHSLSPRMHRAAFAWAGLDGAYEARRVTADELPQAVAGLRHTGVLGANLSLPHKESVVALLDDLTPAAQSIRAVNTVVHREGRLTGDNTDAPGLAQALSDAGYPWSQGAGVVVLGAGGAARAAVYTALRGEQNVWVLNRTRARAEELAADWTAPNPEIQVRAADRHEIPWSEVGLIINASSAGLNAPDETPLAEFDFGTLRPGALVYDMVYKPAETRVMREARAAGVRAENGLGMLAHQARLAFAAWTGRDVPVEVFLSALEDGGGAA
ncbi:shikimate dehydrogenase [Deinococcus hohokamensis]|uniref:Shikimate dehydrogenase (NADP(+)) n=1 Tax=Deinococcus hohokamensis TaxID=309883 RepID=A0ABV9IBP1_9DEIO